MAAVPPRGDGARQNQPAGRETVDAASIRPHLLECGYRSTLIRSDFAFGDGQRASLVAFAYPPADARSACVAVLDGCEDSGETVLACRGLGAPIVFVCEPDRLHWWSQDAVGPRPIQRIAASDVPRFFQEHGAEFRPDRVYRAKTWARFDKEFQLSFVDRGLMPLIEGQIGQALQDLIERNVAALKSNLRWKDIDSEQRHGLLQTVFGLVSAKILRERLHSVRMAGYAGHGHSGTKNYPVHLAVALIFRLNLSPNLFLASSLRVTRVVRVGDYGERLR